MEPTPTSFDFRQLSEQIQAIDQRLLGLSGQVYVIGRCVNELAGERELVAELREKRRRLQDKILIFATFVLLGLGLGLGAIAFAPSPRNNSAQTEEAR